MVAHGRTVSPKKPLIVIATHYCSLRADILSRSFAEDIVNVVNKYTEVLSKLRGE